VTRAWLRALAMAVLVLLLLDWGLGIARLQWPWLSPTLVATNFPSALGYLWLEQQGTAWWQGHVAFWVNDEIGQVTAFLAMVALQAALYVVIFFAWRPWVRIMGEGGHRAARAGAAPGPPSGSAPHA
jgi:hypothetical protein